MRVAAVVLALAPVLFAQGTGRLEFEVAAVKPSQSLGLRPQRSGDRVTWRGAPLGFLVEYAYNVVYYQIAGAMPPQPGQTYDIDAKVPLAATEDEVRRMFQTLLEDRFALKVRHETKEMSVYALVAAPKGHRLKAAQEKPKIFVDGKPVPANEVGVYMARDGRHLAGTGVSMAQFASGLSRAVGGPVEDRTGISGRFDIDVVHGADNAKFEESQLPSLRAAIPDVLGLRLQDAKGPVKILVIEHIGTPGEN